MRIAADGDAVIDAAEALRSVSLDGLVPIVSLSSMNVPGALRGVFLGNGLTGVFESLEVTMDAKAENLKQIFTAMTDLDARAAAGLG